MFREFTASYQMSLDCRFRKKSVTSTESVSLKNCVDVAHVANVIVVTSKHDTFVMFLITSTSKFTKEFSIIEINIIQKLVQLQNFLKFREIVHLNNLSFSGISLFASGEKKSNIF